MICDRDPDIDDFARCLFPSSAVRSSRKEQENEVALPNEFVDPNYWLRGIT
jgi:hypothetical protein